jgi:hypothetical protein
MPPFCGVFYWGTFRLSPVPPSPVNERQANLEPEARTFADAFAEALEEVFPAAVEAGAATGEAAGAAAESGVIPY